MPIDNEIYENIKEIIEIPTPKIWDEFENPLIEFRLRYIKKSDGHTQEYIYPTKPQIIFNVLQELSSKGLIEKSQFEKLEEEVKKLEEKLQQNKYYTRNIHPPKI